MNKCANPKCSCEEAGVERGAARFCSATCADAANASSLADAMCGCSHGECPAD
jgi:hypothetical protein